MSKINYHIKAHKHEAVSKAKRMLNKIEKHYGGFQGKFYCNIQFTGINDIDRREIKRLVEHHLKKLKLQIEKQLLQNEKFVNGDYNDNYEEGYYTPYFKDELQLIEALNEVYSFIWNNYPDIEVKQSEPYMFKSQTDQEKFNEAVSWSREKLIYGYNQVYYAITEDGKNKELFPLTLSTSDFTNTIGVFVSYQ